MLFCARVCLNTNIDLDMNAERVILYFVMYTVPTFRKSNIGVLY